VQHRVLAAPGRRSHLRGAGTAATGEGDLCAVPARMVVHPYDFVEGGDLERYMVKIGFRRGLLQRADKRDAVMIGVAASRGFRRPFRIRGPAPPGRATLAVRFGNRAGDEEERWESSVLRVIDVRVAPFFEVYRP
jgi:hypothetical protein